MKVVTMISVYASGLMGILIVQVVGPYLAMGAQMYTGNTEPHHPHLAWPLGWSLFFGVLPIPFLVAKRWNAGMLASFPLALLPWWQLYCLYGLAV
jgi:hypothetical protein